VYDRDLHVALAFLLYMTVQKVGAYSSRLAHGDHERACSHPLYYFSADPPHPLESVHLLNVQSEVTNNMAFNLPRILKSDEFCLPPSLGRHIVFGLSVCPSVTKCCAHFSSEADDRRGLKLCTVLHYH
jgi:hypothetical protein